MLLFQHHKREIELAPPRRGEAALQLLDGVSTPQRLLRVEKSRTFKFGLSEDSVNYFKKFKEASTGLERGSNNTNSSNAAARPASLTAKRRAAPLPLQVSRQVRAVLKREILFLSLKEAGEVAEGTEMLFEVLRRRLPAASPAL